MTPHDPSPEPAASAPPDTTHRPAAHTGDLPASETTAPTHDPTVPAKDTGDLPAAATTIQAGDTAGPAEDARDLPAAATAIRARDAASPAEDARDLPAAAMTIGARDASDAAATAAAADDTGDLPMAAMTARSRDTTGLAATAGDAEHPVTTGVARDITGLGAAGDEAALFRAAAAAVEAGDAAGLAAVLARIVDDCPGTLAVSVRRASTVSAAGMPLGPTHAGPLPTDPPPTGFPGTDPPRTGLTGADPKTTGLPGADPEPISLPGEDAASTGRSGADPESTGPSGADAAHTDLSSGGTTGGHLSISSHELTDLGPLWPDAGTAALTVHEDVEMPLASVGKLLLLAEVAMSIDADILDPGEPVSLHDDDYCGGSGLLTELSGRTWTVGDLALLTASVSDNTATNALLRRIGLDRVNAAGAALGLTRTRLLDRIREPRGPEHPPAFALGTARELAGLAALVAGPAGWQVQMRRWMLANTDHGLVPASMGHDPEGGRLANKTGTDDGVRTDVGLIGSLAYAVLACGPPGSDSALVTAVRRAGALITAVSRALPHPRTGAQ